MAPSCEPRLAGRALLLACALLLAGCASAPEGPDVPPDAERPGPPSVGDLTCSFCYEPTVAALPEGLLVDDWSRGWTLVARNGTLTTLTPPKPDLGPDTFTGEPFLVASEGVAVYALLAHSGNGLVNDVQSGRPLHEIRVFRGFPDAAEVAAFRAGEAAGHPRALGDRPWVVAQGPRVFVSWALPNLGGIEGAWSEDGGRTWSEPRIVFQTSALGTPSPRVALSDLGRLLVPTFTGTTTVVGGIDLPARLAVRWSDDGGRSWTEGEGPGILAANAPRGESFWVGTTWGPGVGFVLAWVTEAGPLVVSTSADGTGWSGPRVVHDLGTTGKHPWAEPYGRCVTLSAWSQDVIARRSTLRLVVVHGEETVLEETLAEVEVPQTDFAQHAIQDGHAAFAWLAEGSHRLARVPLDGLGCDAA